MFAELGESILGVTDTMFMAHVGTTELAAIGMADTIYDLFRVALMGLVDAIQIVTARRVGQGKASAVGAAFNQGLAMLVILSLFLTGALKFASPFLTAGVLEDHDLAGAVDAFIQIVAFGIVLHSVNMAMSALLVSLGQTRALIGATIVLAITNFTLGYCLIFGKFGFPAMGIQGAAIASLAAEFASLVYLVVHTLRRVNVRAYGLFRFKGFDWRLVRLISVISWPVTLEALLECLRWFAFFVILAHVSEDILALSNIVYCGYALLLIPNGAFAEIANSRVSSLIGAGYANRIGILTRRLIALSFLFTLPLSILLLIMPGPLLSLFVSEPEMIAGSMHGLQVIALGMLLVIPGQTWLAAVIGTGDTVASFIIELLITLTMLCVAYVGAIMLDWPLQWIWTAVPAGWLVALAGSILYVRTGRWRGMDF